MFRKAHNVLVILYLVAVIVLLNYTKKPIDKFKYYFLFLGLFGQVLLFYLSYHIYKSQHIWYSFYMYALMYVLYILSFTCIDIYFYLDNHRNFIGKIHKDIGSMFVDFVYINFSTVSTMGYGDITPATTLTRGYSSYKIAVAVFMIVFLVSDIVVKTK